MSLCRRLGVRGFELGRFGAQENAKQRNVTAYKSQFGGHVVRMPNVTIRPATVVDRARTAARRLAETFPGAAELARRVVTSRR
jgi:hypothetical protein